MNNSVTLKNNILSQIGSMYYVGNPEQVLKLMYEHKYPTKFDGFYTIGDYSLELRRAIDTRAAKENKIFYMSQIGPQIVLFWFEDARDIASDYFL